MRTPRTWPALALIALLAAPLLPAQTDSIDSLSTERMGEAVTIEGSVTDYRASTGERVPHRVTVTDDSGSVVVVFWPDVAADVATMPTERAEVTISGEVGEYRGQLQVRVSDAAGVQVTSGGEAAAPAATATATTAPSGDVTPLAELNSGMEDTEVTIQGEIVNIRESSNPRAPFNLTLRDDSGEGHVVIWPEVYSLVSPTPSVGTVLRTTGEVGTFRGQVQVATRDAALIHLLGEGGALVSEVSAAPEPEETTPEPAPSGDPIEVSVADIDGSHIGQTVRLEGRAVGVRLAWSARAPNIVTFSDGTSTIPVVMWDDQWSALDPQPEEGDAVRLVGTVNLYEARNEIQIQPTEFEVVD